jgi:hypothetical protein
MLIGLTGLDLRQRLPASNRLRHLAGREHVAPSRTGLDISPICKPGKPPPGHGIAYVGCNFSLRPLSRANDRAKLGRNVPRESISVFGDPREWRGS